MGRTQAGVEHRLKLEWRVDVPTIGNVYRYTKGVFCYLNGFGRPLDLSQCNSESDRFWFNRAWTLQETMNLDKTIFKGVSSDVVSICDKTFQVCLISELVISMALTLETFMAYQETTTLRELYKKISGVCRGGGNSRNETSLCYIRARQDIGTLISLAIYLPPDL